MGKRLCLSGIESNTGYCKDKIRQKRIFLRGRCTKYREHVLNANKYYLPETIPLCEEMNAFTNKFYEDLRRGIE